MTIITLPQSRLLDFTKLKNKKVVIEIENTTHKFSTNSHPSGKNIRYQPIFGSKVYIDDKLYTKSTYGLPFMRFAKHSEPEITYKNKTLFTFDIHYHGLNTVGSVDGTSMEVVFGKSTLLGPEVTFQFPKITNNQSLLWFHNHNMFISMELIYSGAVGLLQIVDDETKWLSKMFKYGNNNIMLIASDLDFNDKGEQAYNNLIVDQNRSAFTAINGISAINWYDKNNDKYTNLLYHKTSKNLVKIDILNACLNWRVYYIGVCDEDKEIKCFHLIQCDEGLVNPVELKMTNIPVAGRVSILVDLDKFKNKAAFVFFYDYDLTEIFDSVQANPSNPNDPTVLGTIPNFENKNQSIYPTPIPDPNNKNQQNNSTNLDYPKVDLINQVNQILQNGTIKIPTSINIKVFLMIVYKSCENKTKKLCKVLELIKKTVFGEENLKKYYEIINKPYFEYNDVSNYLKLLNNKYFYNLPTINDKVPIRNFLLFPETNNNAIASGNVNGVTEFIDSANRIMVDLWNSSELDLNYAIEQYNLTPNNFKPTTLPSSKFKIYKTNDKFSNTAMISNDTITIEFYKDKIAYGEMKEPKYTVNVVFSETDFLNIQQWIELINNTFHNTNVQGLSNYKKLSEILECNWSFFPYQYPYMYNKNICIKSAIIKTKNNSCYYIRILGRWPILQFFGKSMTGSTINDSKSKKQNKLKLENYTTKNNFHIDIHKNKSQYIKCNEYEIYGIYDADIQAFFPYYATTDGEVQLPIACMKRNGELIISSNYTFTGFYDGYLNDKLNSFSVKLKSTELWLYNNSDNANNHQIHFHLTSGFAVPHIPFNSPNLLSIDRIYTPLLYSRDIYQIGPQQTVGFYLTWPNYPSNAKTSSPNIKGVGGVIHCHFLPHNDSNSMIIQYYVDP